MTGFYMMEILVGSGYVFKQILYVKWYNLITIRHYLAFNLVYKCFCITNSSDFPNSLNNGFRNLAV